MDKYELHGAGRVENAAAFKARNRMKRYEKLPSRKRRSWEG
jgi:hypothetical protein